MDSGIAKHMYVFMTLLSLPYGRIAYIRFKGTGLQAGHLSISAPLAVCSVRMYYKGSQAHVSSPHCDNFPCCFDVSGVRPTLSVLQNFLTIIFFSAKENFLPFSTNGTFFAWKKSNNCGLSTQAHRMTTILNHAFPNSAYICTDSKTSFCFGDPCSESPGFRCVPCRISKMQHSASFMVKTLVLFICFSGSWMSVFSFDSMQPFPFLKHRAGSPYAFRRFVPHNRKIFSAKCHIRTENCRFTPAGMLL